MIASGAFSPGPAACKSLATCGHAQAVNPAKVNRAAENKNVRRCMANPFAVGYAMVLVVAWRAAAQASTLAPAALRFGIGLIASVAVAETLRPARSKRVGEAAQETRQGEVLAARGPMRYGAVI